MTQATTQAPGAARKRELRITGILGSSRILQTGMVRAGDSPPVAVAVRLAPALKTGSSATYTWIPDPRRRDQPGEGRPDFRVGCQLIIGAHQFLPNFLTIPLLVA